MLFNQQFLDALVAGTVTQTFRRWPRARVKVGSRLRTAVGVVEVQAVDIVSADEIGPRDVRQAGYASYDELIATLDKYGSGAIHLIRLAFVGEDPRIALREQDTLTDAEFADIAQRLVRLDRTGRPATKDRAPLAHATTDAAPETGGPWTLAVLRLIDAHPDVLAAKLAASLGRETAPFKRDVRKLKELGLTESLEVGYRLSPRGIAVLKRLG